MRKKFRIVAALLVFLASPALAKPYVPPPLEAYGELPGIEEMQISPNGKRFAIVSRIKAERQLFVTEGGKALAASPIGDVKVRDLKWAGNDTVILITSNTADLGMYFTARQTELLGAIIIPLNGEKPELVFSSRRSINNSVHGFHGIRRVGGEWKGYFGGLELVADARHMNYGFDHGRPALFAVDLPRNRPVKVERSAGSGQYRDWLIDGEGEAAATFDLNHDGKWTIDNSRGDEIASGVDPTGDVGLVSLGKDGSTVIYWLEDDQASEVRWFEVPLAGGQPTQVFADIDIDQIFIDDTNGRILGYLRGGSPPRPVMFEPAQQAILDKVHRAFPDIDLDVMDWTPDFNHLLVRTRGNGDSGTWFTVDMTQMKAEPVGYERLKIDPEQVGPISTVDYRASDGMEMDGILTLPPGREAKNLPVIMLPHGGPSSHDEATFDWWAQAFASRGYAVFQPNFRGSTNRDHAFRRAGYGQWGRKMQTDVSDGLAALAKRGIIDPQRACIMGASYGGYAALAGVTLQNGLYRCAVSVGGVSDPKEMYQSDYRESGRSRQVRLALMEGLGDPTLLDEVSPRRFADRADAPVLLIHGEDDTVVLLKQSEEMARALEKAGKPHQLVVLENEDHWLSKEATRKQMLEESMRFVLKHNPPA